MCIALIYFLKKTFFNRRKWFILCRYIPYCKQKGHLPMQIIVRTDPLLQRNVLINSEFLLLLLHHFGRFDGFVVKVVNRPMPNVPDPQYLPTHSAIIAFQCLCKIQVNVAKCRGFDQKTKLVYDVFPLIWTNMRVGPTCLFCHKRSNKLWRRKFCLERDVSRLLLQAGNYSGNEAVKSCDLEP